MAKGSRAANNILFGFMMFITIFSTGLIVTYVGELVTGTTRHGVSSQLGLIVFLALIVYAGVQMLRSRLAERTAVKGLKDEQAILNLAKARNGMITVSETALECQMQISESKKAFERLSLTSVCRVDVTDDGEICYRFPSFEKRAPETIAAEAAGQVIESPQESACVKLEKIDQL